MRKGSMYAAGSYIIWGLLPLFWHALKHVSALEILAHRIVWALVATLLLTIFSGHLPKLWAAMRNWRILLTFTLSAALLTTNWFIYIWAVNAGYVVETSLGYFINPLVNVIFGVLFLHERLRFGQIAAVTVASAGVIYLTVLYGALPWIALVLAGTFGLYGLIRKTAPISSLEGLTLETLIAFVPALGYLIFLESQGHGAFLHTEITTNLLFVTSGVVTAVPLLLFASGARKITMVLLGILQYIAPTLQFILGITFFHEAVTPERLVGFILIWIALSIYTVEGLIVGGRAVHARARAASSAQ